MSDSLKELKLDISEQWMYRYLNKIGFASKIAIESH